MAEILLMDLRASIDATTAKDPWPWEPAYTDRCDLCGLTYWYHAAGLCLHSFREEKSK